jgi:hypothetical protein
MKKELKKNEEEKREATNEEVKVGAPLLSLNTVTGIIREVDNIVDNSVKIKALMEFVSDELNKFGYKKKMFFICYENELQNIENFIVIDNMEPSEVVGNLMQAAVRKITNPYEKKIR